MIRTVRRAGAFSLIELVIVVVIIGIIAAIAIPRMSRGAAGAADNTLVGNLAVLRKSIELYAAEHEGNFPSADPATFAKQLTEKTDVTGAKSGDASKDIYGPYLREVPRMNVGGDEKRRTSKIGPAGGADNGWTYDDKTGDIRANSTDQDKAGKAYNTY